MFILILILVTVAYLGNGVRFARNRLARLNYESNGQLKRACDTNCPSRQWSSYTYKQSHCRCGYLKGQVLPSTFGMVTFWPCYGLNDYIHGGTYTPKIVEDLQAEIERLEALNNVPKLEK